MVILAAREGTEVAFSFFWMMIYSEKPVSVPDAVGEKARSGFGLCPGFRLKRLTQERELLALPGLLSYLSPATRGP